MVYLRNHMIWLVRIIFSLSLSACGGGSGADGARGLPNSGDLQLSQSSVSFIIEQGGQLPTSTDVMLTFSNSDVSEVVAGFLPNQQNTGWLDLKLTGNFSPMALNIRPNTTDLPVGVHNLTVRVGTKHVTQNGPEFKDIRDIAVSYKIIQNINVLADPSAIVLNSTESMTPSLVAIGISFQGGIPDSWSASVRFLGGSDWLTTEIKDNKVFLQALAKTAGNYSADLEIRTIKDGYEKSSFFPVLYSVIPGLDTPRNIDFLVQNSTKLDELSQSLTVRSNISGTEQHWSAKSNQNWLRVSPANGTSGTPNNLNVSIDHTQLPNVGSGIHEAKLTISSDITGVTERDVPVTLDLHLATVTHVAPYTALAGRNGSTLVRGKNFMQNSSPSLKIGTLNPIATTIISDTEIRIDYPAINSTSGYPFALPVYFENALNLIQSDANLVVIEPTAYPSISLAEAGFKYGAAYNAERKELYFGNKIAGKLVRYRYSGTAWDRNELEIHGICDISLSPNGRILAAINDDNIFEVSLDTFTIIKTLTLKPRPANYLQSIAYLNNGQLIAADGNQWSDVFIYDRTGGEVRKLTPPPNENFYSPIVYSPQDGSRAVIAQGLGGAWVLDAANMTLRSTGFGKKFVVSGNLDGRLLVGSDSSDSFGIFDLKQNKFPGVLAVRFAGTDLNGAVISPDGKTAYAYAKDKFTATYNLRKYDLTIPPGTDGLYSYTNVTTAVDLKPSEFAKKMILSEDESVLFTFTSENIIVQALP